MPGRRVVAGSRFVSSSRYIAISWGALDGTLLREAKCG